MTTIEFPDVRNDRLIENALQELANWAESQIELGVSPIVLIGLMETYKSSLCFNLLEDEDDD
mgnify:FL=1|tara:strand:+ start:1239 stop:1424 length:186 start_codon:yes stop_codon:yes gene_type:complete